MLMSLWTWVGWSYLALNTLVGSVTIGLICRHVYDLEVEEREYRKRQAKLANKEYVYKCTILIHLLIALFEYGDCIVNIAKNIIHRKRNGLPVLRA